MRILAGLIIAGAIASTGLLAADGAAAKSSRLDDVNYMQLARCVGLASSSKLDSAESAALNSRLHTQGFGRDPVVTGQADDLQRQAKTAADRSDGAARDKLNAELHGTCAALKS